MRNSNESVGGMNKAQPDKRGQYLPTNMKDHSIIVTHIKKYNPQISHYRWEHAPNRKYISSETTLRNMYDDFLKENPDHCTYSTYHAVFKKQNIAFGERRKIFVIHVLFTKIYKKMKLQTVY